MSYGQANMYMDDMEVINEISRITGITYSEEQLNILKHHGGMCILACAGSGKTTVLTHLLAKRIKTGEIHDVKKLLCTTYSKAGSNEMEERLDKLLQKLGINVKVQVKTLHASYYMILRHFGLTAGVCSNNQRLAFITAACKEAEVTLGDEDLQLIDSLLSYQVNNLLSDEELIHSYVYTLEDVPLSKYSAIRLGYNKKKEEAGVIDFDDMQLYMYMLLVKEKRQDILAFCRNLWEYFFIDEFQDVSKIQFAILRELVTDPNKLIVIGDDDQCLIEGTLVQTPRGQVPIETLQPGDFVTAGIGEGKTLDIMINNISKKKISEDVVVLKTKGGREIKGTANHIGFARLVPNENYYYTYLMYNKDIGYRIGTTGGVRAGSRGEIRNDIDMRLMQERSDKVWLLKKSDNKEDALYWESYFAYKYGIPMYRFVDNSEGTAKTALGRETIIKLHEQLGTRNKGMQLLKDLGIDYNYPHRVPQAEGTRNKINFTMFGSGQTDKMGIHKSELSINTSNRAYLDIIKNYLSVCKRKATSSNYEYYNARSTTNDIDKQEEIIKDILRDCTDNNIYVDINKEAKLNNNKYMFMPLGNIVEGMYVPVLNGDKIEEDEVVSVTREHYDGYVYDISVPMARNFIANNIVVHNCIYQWRGADPNIILNICGYYDIQRFVLSTNYRCGGEIVKHAAVGIRNNEKRADKTMVPFNEGGEIKICNTGPGNLYHMSLYAFKHIMNAINVDKQSPSDIAILSRNNNHLAILNNMLFDAGVYCITAPEMRMTNISIYKDLKNVMLLGENTYNHNVVASTLWRVCSYLGTKGARVVANFMKESGCSLKDSLGYILTTFAKRNEVKWTGNIKIPKQVESKLAHAYFDAIRREPEDSLIYIYKLLNIQDEAERVGELFELYIEATEFMYKTEDKARTVSGLVDYFKALIKKKGIEETKSFLRMTEQYESGNMVVPGSKITMSTMHGAKGREWPHVILFADDNVTFPSFEGIGAMRLNGIDMKDISGSIDENRRLHYVAMTRAKQKLVIFTNIHNISVYTLEALGLLSKDGCQYNSHIINMAQSGSLPTRLVDDVRSKVMDENSPYYYKLSIDDAEEFVKQSVNNSNNSNDSVFIEGDDTEEDYNMTGNW